MTRERVVGSSAHLVAAQAVRMSLGLAFWLLAARIFSAAEVGLAAAAISATMLCVLIAPLGAGSAFVALVPGAPERASSLARTALLLVALASLTTALVFLLLFATALGGLEPVAADAPFATAFVLTCVFASVHELADELAVGSWRPRQVVARAAAFGATGIAAVGLLWLTGAADGSRSLYASWALGALAAAVLAVAGYRALARQVWPREPRRSLELRGMLGVGLRNHAVTVAERAPALVVPLVIAQLLGRVETAYWYVAWMVALAVFTIPVQTARALFADVARRPAHASRSALRGGAFALGAGVCAAGILAALAGEILELLGEGYSQGATTPARILLAGVVPLAFVQAYVAVSRGLRRLNEILVVVGIFGAVAVLSAALASVRFGLPGAAAAWVLAQTGFALFAGLRLRAVLRPRPARSALVPAR